MAPGHRPCSGCWGSSYWYSLAAMSPTSQWQHLVTNTHVLWCLLIVGCAVPGQDVPRVCPVLLLITVIVAILNNCMFYSYWLLY